MNRNRFWRHLRYGWGPEPPDWANAVTGMLVTLVIVLIVIFIFINVAEGIRYAKQINVPQSASSQE